MQSYTVYTDGSCLKNPGGPGGYSCVIINNNTGDVISSEAHSELDTTNNRMELKAAILALNRFVNKTKITIVTDSTYVRNGFEKRWIYHWMKNGWKSASGTPVKNKDLWLTLLDLVNKHDVHFELVKGHSGNEYNDMVDRLAKDAAIDASLGERK